MFWKQLSLLSVESENEIHSSANTVQVDFDSVLLHVDRFQIHLCRNPVREMCGALVRKVLWVNVFRESRRYGDNQPYTSVFICNINKVLIDQLIGLVRQSRVAEITNLHDLPQRCPELRRIITERSIFIIDGVSRKLPLCDARIMEVSNNLPPIMVRLYFRRDVYTMPNTDALFIGSFLNSYIEDAESMSNTDKVHVVH